MDYRLKKKLGIPTGVWIILSYEETCKVTDGRKAVPAIAALAAEIPQPWGTLVASALAFQLARIRSANEASGYQGVELFVEFLLGTVTHVRPRGGGASTHHGGAGGSAGGGHGGGGTSIKERAIRPPQARFSIEGPWNIRDPVHELITEEALRKACLISSAASYSSSFAWEFIRGVLWNDDPEGLLFDDNDTETDNWSSGLMFMMRFAEYRAPLCQGSCRMRLAA